MQPGIKCRGRDYLRIIYGPEYADPSQIDRLRGRGLGRKRSLAVREFALGVEALEPVPAPRAGPVSSLHRGDPDRPERRQVGVNDVLQPHELALEVVRNA